jgi:hypothetical protein
MRKAQLTAISVAVALTAVVVAHVVLAQQPHGTASSQVPDAHSMHGAPTSNAPSQPGQDALAAIAEVVRLLDADPNTDWPCVDLERLRQHLIDMNEVVLRAQVQQRAVPGGLTMDVTGSGRTARAIQAMVVPHAVELNQMAYAARTETIPGGVRLTVTTKTPDDPRSVARLRGLGFIGLLTEGAHHGPHHLAMARGDAMPGHGHTMPGHGH